MKYESAKTEKGNIGVSFESQALADQQAADMDAGGNRDCYNCSRCSGCSRCFDLKNAAPVEDESDRTMEALEQKAETIDSRHKEGFIDLKVEEWMADEYGLLMELDNATQLFHALMSESNSGTGKTEALAAMNDALRNQAKKIAEAEWEEERARLMRDVY